MPVYLTSVGLGPQSPVERPSGFPDFHWLHTLEGEGMVELEGDTRLLGRGEGFLMFPDVPHRYSPQGPWETMWFTFHGEPVFRFLDTWGLRTGFIQLSNVELFSALIHEMLRVGREPAALQGPALSSLAYRFLNELLLESVQTPVIRQGRDRLQPLLEYISDNLHTPLSLGEMAEMLGLTPQHLCRLFQKVLGTSPLRYITALRMSRAKTLLIDEPALPVSEVGKRVGFSNHSYFCSVFKQYERKTPSEFRALRLGIPLTKSSLHRR